MLYKWSTFVSKALDDIPADIFFTEKCCKICPILLDMMSDCAGRDRNARIDRTKSLRIKRQQGVDVTVQETTLKQGHRRQLTVFQESWAAREIERSGSVNIHRVLMYGTHLLTVKLNVGGRKIRGPNCCTFYMTRYSLTRLNRFIFHFWVSYLVDNGTHLWPEKKRTSIYPRRFLEHSAMHLIRSIVNGKCVWELAPKWQKQAHIVPRHGPHDILARQTPGRF